jgi:glycosyltransferase involved in cell wall biosynthesis
MRVAWLGPVGEPGGNGALGTLLLAGLLDGGVDVDLLFPAAAEGLPGELVVHPRLRVLSRPIAWERGRWYSPGGLPAFVSNLAARSLSHRGLSRELLMNNAVRPYDCIFQFSQPELFLLGRKLEELPPIVVHPGTHAAGELRWHRAESAYARRGEGRLFHYVTRAMFYARTLAQRRELRKPAIVAGPSKRFCRHLEEDYNLPAERLRVLRHPVDLETFTPRARPPEPGRVLTLLYVARLSVRKGLEHITALSHRLADLEGQVRIAVVGDRSLWSDYRAHLADLDPAIAEYRGPVPPTELAELLRSGDALLIPSRYEPGAIVVSQALACGLPIVASDQVGPAEVIDPSCCRVFPSGDLDAFERATRQLIADLRADGRGLRERARAQAETHFAPSVIANQLIEILAAAAGTNGGGPDSSHAEPSDHGPDQGVIDLVGHGS